MFELKPLRFYSMSLIESRFQPSILRTGTISGFRPKLQYHALTTGGQCVFTKHDIENTPLKKTFKSKSEHILIYLSMMRVNPALKSLTALISRGADGSPKVEAQVTVRAWAPALTKAEPGGGFAAPYARRRVPFKDVLE